MKKTIVLTFIFTSLVVAANSFDHQAVDAYFKTTEGRVVVKQAVEAGLTEDEIKYAVVRFFHTPDGQKMISVLVEKHAEKQVLKNGRLIDKEIVKIVVVGTLGILALRSLQDGFERKTILALMLFALCKIF